LSIPSVQLVSQVTGEPQSGGQEPHPPQRSQPEQPPKPHTSHGKVPSVVQFGSAQAFIPSQSSSTELVQFSAGGSPQSFGQLHLFSGGSQMLLPQKPAMATAELAQVDNNVAPTNRSQDCPQGRFRYRKTSFIDSFIGLSLFQTW
jgi:hypothetical protein